MRRTASLSWTAAFLCLLKGSAGALQTESDLVCELNGVLNDQGRCTCFAGWKGPHCGQLDLIPASHGDGYHHTNESTWGGQIVMAEDGSYHIYLAAMGGGCGLTSWCSNSLIIHAESKSATPLGPYVRKDPPALGVWSHNPSILRDPVSGKYLLFHIGSGKDGESQLRDCPGHNGTSQCGLFFPCEEESSYFTKERDDLVQDSRRHLQVNSASSLGAANFTIHVSDSPDGPFQSVDLVVENGFINNNNPAPFLLKNGSMLLSFNDGSMSLFMADSWEGPYRLVTRGACGGGEDPFLFVDEERGYYHCLYHREPLTTPDIAIGHSYSKDARNWFHSEETAANSTIEFAGYGHVVFGKRERPHLFFDKAGGGSRPTHFITGVCITPQCNPLEPEEYDPTADCSSTAQYLQCDRNYAPGHFDRTWTLVQALR